MGYLDKAGKAGSVAKEVVGVNETPFYSPPLNVEEDSEILLGKNFLVLPDNGLDTVDYIPFGGVYERPVFLRPAEADPEVTNYFTIESSIYPGYIQDSYTGSSIIYDIDFLSSIVDNTTGNSLLTGALSEVYGYLDYTMLPETITGNSSLTTTLVETYGYLTYEMEPEITTGNSLLTGVLLELFAYLEYTNWVPEQYEANGLLTHAEVS